MNVRNHSEFSNGQSVNISNSTAEIAVSPPAGPWTVAVLGSATSADAHACLQPGVRLILGSCPSCDLRILDDCVSGRHCMLDATATDVVLVDLGSKNGVYLGNARVESARLSADPTTFTIGRTKVIVRSARHGFLPRDDYSIDGIEGRSEPMLRLKRAIHKLAGLRAPVLITGETGVGKDVVARALHTLSRRTGPYLPLNVATIPETLADSELFGHRKGAFTGAVQHRSGAFDQAQGGTLFLDEIGELAPTIQSKMLRILEDGVVRPVGAIEGHRVDVRVVSATWSSLAEKSAIGRFRFDLLQRLSMLVLEVPPLRERRSDVPLLSDYWLRRHSTEFGTKALSAAALERLCHHDWPGNVRELGSVIYRACLTSESEMIDLDDVNRAFSMQGMRYSRAGLSPRELLIQTGGNVSEAARLAGLPRTTFRTWLGRVKAPDNLEKKTNP